MVIRNELITNVWNVYDVLFQFLADWLPTRIPWNRYVRQFLHSGYSVHMFRKYQFVVVPITGHEKINSMCWIRDDNILRIYYHGPAKVLEIWWSRLRTIPCKHKYSTSFDIPLQLLPSRLHCSRLICLLRWENFPFQ